MEQISMCNDLSFIFLPQIADWKFPYKRSHHPVCLHESTRENKVVLRNCDPEVTPGTEVYVFREAAVCSCSLCKSSEASCQGLRYRGARRAPRDVDGVLRESGKDRTKRSLDLQFEESATDEVDVERGPKYNFLRANLPIGAFGPGVISSNVESSDGLHSYEPHQRIEFENFLRAANKSESANRLTFVDAERMASQFKELEEIPPVEKYKIMTEDFGLPSFISVKRFGVDFPSNMMKPVLDIKKRDLEELQKLKDAQW